jgi:hypothetical protein
MPYRLYLDDVRNPTNTFPTTLNSEWVIVRSYKEFVKAIEDKGLPFMISFDHDLADEHYRHFVKVIEDKGLPFMISFDHDLADEHYRPSMYDKDKHYTQYYNDGTFKEMTGYHCAVFLVTYCIDNNLDFPKYNVHSMNPVGKSNIISYIESFIKSRE